VCHGDLLLGNGVYTLWAQHEGYDIPPTIRVVCIILKSPWEPLTCKSLDYASGSMGGNFPWLTTTGTVTGSRWPCIVQRQGQGSGSLVPYSMGRK